MISARHAASPGAGCSACTTAAASASSASVMRERRGTLRDASVAPLPRPAATAFRCCASRWCRCWCRICST
eukprot:scaffold59027_cov54-Phaeocystis_antarctica.AAC.3